MALPAFMTSSTSKSCVARMVARLSVCLFTVYESQIPSEDGAKASPVVRFSPIAFSVRSCSSSTLMMASCTSSPLFSARVLGIIIRASAKACTPSLALPVTACLRRSSMRQAAISKEPAPGTNILSSRAPFTARRPSRTASLIWSMVCLLGPRMSTVHELPCLASSTKVNLSSPRVSSRILPAQPNTEGSKSSTAFTGNPPQASVSLSILRRLARRSAKIPSRANISSDTGSIPFWLITTKLSPSLHTERLKAITAFTFSSVNLRSLSTSLSRSSAVE
mmetsp:Transcript_17526/g.29379  ORF Transcript_17526/g.29379 Transcript_17526/m.29379 type:complete len:278 (+) Transcript_17526:260-1093(+)